MSFGATTVSYKVPVFDAMGRIGVRIVISFFGYLSTNDALTLPPLAVIGEGLVLHAAVVVIWSHCPEAPSELFKKDESVQNIFVAAGLQALNTTPTPGPGNDGLRPGLTADQVSPGLLGFVMTAFMVIAVVMLMVSMTRRIRRVRYQAQFIATGQDTGEATSETADTAVAEQSGTESGPPADRPSPA